MQIVSKTRTCSVLGAINIIRRISIWYLRCFNVCLVNHGNCLYIIEIELSGMENLTQA